METSRLYESPFTDKNSMGVNGVFKKVEIIVSLAVVRE
jgi:hypothetical protein